MHMEQLKHSQVSDMLHLHSMDRRGPAAGLQCVSGDTDDGMWSQTSEYQDSDDNLSAFTSAWLYRP